MEKEEIDEEAFLNLESSHLKEMGQLFDIFVFTQAEEGNGWNGSCQKIKSSTIWHYMFFIDKHNVHDLNELRFHENSVYILKIQWNLSIADMLYSGHLSIADTILENQLQVFY